MCFVNTDDPSQWTLEEITRLWGQSVVYFVKATNLSQLNRALLYIEENEEARSVKVVHVYDESEPTPQYLIECVRLLDCVYPKIRVDCILVPGTFGPAIVEHLSSSLGVPVNSMLMNCPKETGGHSWSLDQLRGVRVILNSETSSLLEKIDAPGNFMSQVRNKIATDHAGKMI